jgi:hypothetical protein
MTFWVIFGLMSLPIIVLVIWAEVMLWQIRKNIIGVEK